MCRASVHLDPKHQFLKYTKATYRQTLTPEITIFRGLYIRVLFFLDFGFRNYFFRDSDTIPIYV